ncbi:hypothetical protein ES705_17531 [subsurface metagenome]
MSPWFLQVAAENRSNRSKTLRSAVRVQHFFEHVTESVDSLAVWFFPGGYPVVAPGENGDAPGDKFFTAWPTAVNELVGPGPGLGPGDNESAHGNDYECEWDPE